MNEPVVEMNLSCARETAVRPSERVLQVAAMFGLGVDESRKEQVIPPVKLLLGRGMVIFLHGPSGSGKSTLLRLIREEALQRAEVELIEVGRSAGAGGAGDDATGAGEGADVPLVDRLGGSLEEATAVLAAAGLGDAFVMLRCEEQLSDGQRSRWLLAQLMAQAATVAPEKLPLVLVDEFAATLDRRTAAIIARNVHRFARKAGVCVVVAGTHEDILEALDPDLLVYIPLGEAIEVLSR